MSIPLVSLIASDRALWHLTGVGHPEQPLRYIAIRDILRGEHPFVLPAAATEAQLLLCHSQEYIDLVFSECSRLAITAPFDGTVHLSTGDVNISPSSFSVALLSAGAACTAVDIVMGAGSNTAFSLMRPPGHHASSSCGMGFCLFNSIAIAARYAQRQYGIDRVLIVDWDVHHGNGTQDIFYSDPSVFYFSTHQYPLYPGTGSSSETGAGIGKGATLNIPITAGRDSREHVIAAFQEFLPIIAERFRPQLICISAGFDAHRDDPIGGLNLTAQDFSILTHAVRAVADKYASGRIVSILEGGYNLRSLAVSASAHVVTLGE